MKLWGQENLQRCLIWSPSFFSQTGNGDNSQRCDGIGGDVIVTLRNDPGWGSAFTSAWDANLRKTWDVFIKNGDYIMSFGHNIAHYYLMWIKIAMDIFLDFTARDNFSMRQATTRGRWELLCAQSKMAAEAGIQPSVYLEHQLSHGNYHRTNQSQLIGIRFNCIFHINAQGL